MRDRAPRLAASILPRLHRHDAEHQPAKRHQQPAGSCHQSFVANQALTFSKIHMVSFGTGIPSTSATRCVIMYMLMALPLVCRTIRRR